QLAAAAEQVRVNGGWVFALGRGPLDDRRSTVHRRDRFGIRRRGGYFSVDTGKYSTGPWLALRVANAILPPRPGRGAGVADGHVVARSRRCR
ncbi:MAG: hypothetical protein H6Q11_1658, partial [Acidobacteria bacterium]|nr:hypothetical protein [Acidobacteriota bacterium]